MGRDLSAPARVACQLTILYCYATLPFWQVQRLLLLRKLLQLKHLRQQRQQEQQQQQHGKQRRGGQLGNCSGEVPGVMAALGPRHLAAWPAAVSLLEAELCDEEFIVRARRELEREEGKTEDIEGGASSRRGGARRTEPHLDGVVETSGEPEEPGNLGDGGMGQKEVLANGVGGSGAGRQEGAAQKLGAAERGGGAGEELPLSQEAVCNIPRWQADAQMGWGDAELMDLLPDAQWFYFGAWRDAHRLVEVRRMWDAHLCREAHVHSREGTPVSPHDPVQHPRRSPGAGQVVGPRGTGGTDRGLLQACSTVPSGWVLPSPPSSDAWAAYLVHKEDSLHL